jgi:tetratricopeptide (TPR) repeat protein
MSKTDEKLITRAAISELERLSRFLDTESEAAASMPIEEVENGLRELGFDPDQPLPKRVAYVYVSDEPLQGECSDEMKLLILEIRYLTRQQRYEEALDLAIMATESDSNYWRAWISRGSLLVLFGATDEGDKVFERVLRDFPDNPKAVAAGLHGRAWVQEVRCGLNLSADKIQEVSHLYEKALQFDDSRTNTRACLLINSLMSDRDDNDQKLLEDSALYEGFFDALGFELTKRGAKTLKAFQTLPAWLRHLLYPIRPIFGA